MLNVYYEDQKRQCIVLKSKIIYFVETQSNTLTINMTLIDSRNLHLKLVV